MDPDKKDVPHLLLITKNEVAQALMKRSKRWKPSDPSVMQKDETHFFQFEGRSFRIKLVDHDRKTGEIILEISENRPK
jgi:hypothetical protein